MSDLDVNYFIVLIDRFHWGHASRKVSQWHRVRAGYSCGCFFLFARNFGSMPLSISGTFQPSMVIAIVWGTPWLAQRNWSKITLGMELTPNGATRTHSRVWPPKSSIWTLVCGDGLTASNGLSWVLCWGTGRLQKKNPFQDGATSGVLPLRPILWRSSMLQPWKNQDGVFQNQYSGLSDSKFWNGSVSML